MPLSREEYVRLRAYALWNEEGQPEGREKAHWDRAATDFDGRPKLWRFVPVASVNDDRWLGGPIWAEVMVSAPTSGIARFLASRWEADRLGHKPTEDTAGNTTMSYQSTLADPALYHLEEIHAEALEDFGVVGEPQLLMKHGGQNA